jgi:hypothetical protein
MGREGDRDIASNTYEFVRLRHMVNTMVLVSTTEVRIQVASTSSNKKAAGEFQRLFQAYTTFAASNSLRPDRFSRGVSVRRFPLRRSELETTKTSECAMPTQRQFKFPP